MQTSAKKRAVFQVDMLHGGIARPIILFSIPVLFSSLFQQLYNTVDTIIVSYALGENALAAMGMCSSFYFLLVGFALGCGNGFSVVLGRCFGGGDEGRMRRCVAASLVISLLLSMVLSVGGIALLPAFFRLTNAPADLIPQATAYCSTILSGAVALIGYNWCVGLFNAMGNSFVPLCFLILSSGLNILLDYDFIVNRGMDVEGAALATVIAQGISVLGCWTYILLKTRHVLPRKGDWAFDHGIYSDLVTQGLSQGLMYSIVSAGSVILQAGINGFGSIIIASHTASRKVLDFCFRVFDGVYAAVMTFVAQNRGAITGGVLTRAEGRARIKKGILFGYGAGTVIALALAAVAIPFSPAIVQAITGSADPELIETSALYLRVAVPMTVVLNVLFISRNALQALGQRVLPVIASVIEFVGKIVFVWLLVPRLGYFAVILCEPVLWVFMVMELVPALWLNELLRRE